MNPSSPLGAGFVLLAWLTVMGCGHRGDPAPAGSASAIAAKPVGSAAAIGAGNDGAPPDAAVVVAFDPPPDAASVTELASARSNKLCRTASAEIAAYQSEGVLGLGAGKGGIGASWLVHVAGKRDEQIAFSSFDTEGKAKARPRGVGLAGQKTVRVFASGTGFTVTWFDANALAFARPRTEPLPPPEIGHLSMFGPEVAADVALAATEGGSVVAAAPFGAEKKQLGLFQFSPAEDGAPPVTALGVTHHAVAPSRPAVAAGEGATFVAWFEPDGRILASRFDAKGKESDAACVVAPAAAEKREHLALAAVGSGVIALWMEGSMIRTRALDGSGCPISPAWKVAEGRFATLAAAGEAPLVAWLASDGRLLAAKLGPNGAPTSKGLDIADGSLGLKDPPALAVTSGRVAFGWAEAMSPIISTRRLMLRLVDAACFP